MHPVRDRSADSTKNAIRPNTSHLKDRYIAQRKNRRPYIDDCPKSESTAYTSMLLRQIEQHSASSDRGTTLTEPIFQGRSISVRDCLIKQFDPTIKRQTKRNICLDRHWDLPSLINDFYGEPIDWAATGIICLSLGSSVILTSRNGDINNISRSGSFETVASVKLHNNKLLCAAGTYYGCLEVYDLEKMRMIRCTRQSAMRIGCLTWSGNQLIAGGRDHSVRIFDLSMKNPLVKQYKQHKEQVGGVAIMNHILASGSDDKSVKIWDLRSDRVMHDLVGYNATIKALAWCPWRNNVLATGAGSEDGRIICWNLSSEPVKIDERNTESSVSCVLWNTHFREMISAHGRPFNCIGIWKYQHLGKPLVLLNGHRDRIMKVCIGPDNDMMCSVGADDALKFWKLDAQPEDIERVSLNRAIVR